LHQQVCAHWCLVVVNILKKEIVCYDSLCKENSACLEQFKSYIFEVNNEDFAVKQDTNIPSKPIPMIAEHLFVHMPTA